MKVQAQSVSVLEYSLPYEVIQRVDEYVNSLKPEERGEPFLIFRAAFELGGNSELAVRVGTRSESDSLLLSQPGRKLNGTEYHLAFAGEARYGVRYVDGTHATYAKCVLNNESMFVITFREDPKIRIVRTGHKSVLWCASK